MIGRRRWSTATVNPAANRGADRARPRRRLRILRIVIVALLVVLGGRLWWLQVPDGQHYASAAADNRTRDVVTPAPRGRILDDRGRPLADTSAARIISVDSHALADQSDNGAAVLARLSTVLSTSADELRRRIRPCGKGVDQPCWNGQPSQPVPVDTHAPVAATLQIAEHAEDFPGVQASVTGQRNYPSGTLAAQVLGHLAPITAAQLASPQFAGATASDLVGSVGIEKQYDKALRGVDGVRSLAVDNAGRVTGVAAEKAAVPGSDLHTHIDANLQKLVQTSLANRMAQARKATDHYGQRYRADSGAAVVLDARNGAVLAMASNPTFDANVWTGGISSTEYARLQSAKAHQPLLSRAVDGQYAPGSTWKVVSTAAAIASGFPLNGTYNCPGEVTIGGRAFHNFESIAYGPISLRRALIKSCDTVFYPLAVADWKRDGGLRPSAGQAKETFAATSRGFGFGAPTGIDLPRESAGRVPDRAYKKQLWADRKGDYCAGAKNPSFSDTRRTVDTQFCQSGYLLQAGDAANAVIGQGDVLSTPLQLAAAYVAIANGGTRWQPQIAASTSDASGAKTWTNKPKKTGSLPVDRTTLGYIRSALTGVPEKGGTAYSSFTGWPQDRIPVAGKTGTAEVGLTKTARQDNTWFASFAPADKPRYVVVTFMEEVGGHQTAEAARDIYSGLFGVGRAKLDMGK